MQEIGFGAWLEVQEKKRGDGPLDPKSVDQYITDARCVNKVYGNLDERDWSSCFTNYKAGQALEGVRRQGRFLFCCGWCLRGAWHGTGVRRERG